jgi:hypothetical protein
VSGVKNRSGADLCGWGAERCNHIAGGSTTTVSAARCSKVRFTVRPIARVRCTVRAGIVTASQGNNRNVDPLSKSISSIPWLIVGLREYIKFECQRPGDFDGRDMRWRVTEAEY